MKKRILLAGAAGYLGGHIADELLKHNYHVKALTRNRDKLVRSHPEIQEIAEAQITRPPSLEGCCEGIDAVITTIGITRQKDGLI